MSNININIIKVVQYIRATGEIIMSGTTCSTEGMENDDVGIITDVSADIHNQYVFDGEIVDKPPQPSAIHYFDYSSKSWVDPRSLEEIKTAQWALIKAARSEAEFGGFTWDGSMFDSDQVSQARIQGAVLLATSNPDFVVDWTLADNTVRSLTADDLIAISQALGEHISLQHTRARNARALLDQATTFSEVQAVSF